MKKVFIKIIVIMFLIVIGCNININSSIGDQPGKKELNTSNNNDKYYYLSTDTQRLVVDHMSNISIEYTLSNNDSIRHCSYSYEINSQVTQIISFNSNNNILNFTFTSIDTGEHIIKIIANITTNENENITIQSNIYVFSTETHDFVSKSSIDDAKFFCYELMTKTDTPSYEEYDNFFTTFPLQNTDNFEIFNNSQKLSNYSLYDYSITDNFKVTGTIEWKDSSGISHPAVNVKVEIIDQELFGINNVLETVYTGSDGRYTAIIDTSIMIFENGGFDIKCRISASSNSIKVVNNSDVVYSKTTTVYKDVVKPPIDSTLYIPYTFENNSDIGQAFQVHQAMMMASDYVKSKRSGKSLDSINIIFPTNEKKTSCFTGDEIHILKADCNDWDVMHHEYGHYVQDFYGIDDSPSKTHSSRDCLASTYGKDDGIKLAWGEGWATYFAISLQQEMKASLLNIPDVGNLFYQDTLDSTLNYDLETLPIERKLGESNEATVAAVLLDLADPKNDDNVEMTYDTLWRKIIEKKCTTLDCLISHLTIENSFENLEYGHILSINSVSASLISPSNNDIAKYDNQEFSWDAQGGDGNYINNSFSLVFFDQSKNFICETERTTSTNLTVNNEMWTEILNLNDEFIYWAVKCWQTKDFETGPYYSNYYKIYIPNPTVLNIDTDNNSYLSLMESEWYSFTAPETSLYYFYTEGQVNTIGELFNKLVSGYDSTFILESNNNNGIYENFGFYYRLNAGESVFLRVRGEDGLLDTGYYTVYCNKINIENTFLYPGNTLLNLSPSEKKIYQINFNKSELLMLYTKYKNVNLELYECSNSKLIQKIDNYSEYNNPIKYLIESGKQYYLFVSSEYDNSNELFISYNVNPDSIDDINIIVEKNENNEPVKYHESISTYGEFKFYEFTPLSSGEYTFSTNALNNGDTYMELYDNNGNLICTDDDSGVIWSAKIKYYLIKDINYYISIKFKHHLATGSYDLQVYNSLTCVWKVDWLRLNKNFVNMGNFSIITDFYVFSMGTVSTVNENSKTLNFSTIRWSWSVIDPVNQYEFQTLGMIMGVTYYGEEIDPDSGYTYYRFLLIDGNGYLDRQAVTPNTWFYECTNNDVSIEFSNEEWYYYFNEGIIKFEPIDKI